MQLVPIKVSPEFLDLVDKLVLLSQLGFTKQRYKSRTEFIRSAMRVQALSLLEELQADRELESLLDKTLGHINTELLL